MSEAVTQRRTVVYALSRGVPSIRLCLRPGVAVGWPDALFLVPGGRPLFVEFKSSGGRPTAWQLRKLEMLRSLGYRAALAHSFEEAKDLLDKALEDDACA